MSRKENVSWSEPRLCHSNYNLEKPWFVYFSVTDAVTGKTLKKQFRNGINTLHTKKERVQAAKDTTRFLVDRLENGWNPITDEEPEIIAPTDKPTDVRQAIEKVIALKKTSLKTKSIRNYNDSSNMFLKWCDKHKYSKLPLWRINFKVAQAYKDYLLLERNYSGRSYNIQLGYRKSFLMQ